MLAMRLYPFLLAVTLLDGCRSRSLNDSHLQADTELGATSEDDRDLTRYTTNDPALYERMRHEMNQFDFDYLTFKELAYEANPPSSIHIDEVIALKLYTSNAYRFINKALRSKDPTLLPEYRGIIKAAASGLNKIKGEPCVAKRGTEMKRQYLDDYTEGKTHPEPHFLSTTYGELVNPFDKKPVQFKITSDNCKKIDWLSEFPEEREVLFPPGSEFLVTKKEVWVKDGIDHANIEMTHVMLDSDAKANEAFDEKH